MEDKNMYEIIKEIFRMYGIKIFKIEETENSYNSKVYKVISDKLYIIKFYLNKSKMECEAKYLQYLASFIPVASVVKKAIYKNNLFIIMTYLNGKSYSDDDANLLSEKQIFEIGKILGKLHKIPILDKNDLNSWIKYLIECLDMVNSELENYLGIALNTKIQDYLRKQIDGLIKNNYHNSITHMDFRIGNLIIDNNNVSLIDFENVKNGDYVFDFVKSFKILSKQQFQLLLKGFKTEFEVDKDFYERLKFYLLFDSYTCIYWCIQNNQVKGTFFKNNMKVVDIFSKGIY